MKLVVHSFKLSDVDDPQIYAAGPIWDWQQSPAGQWVLHHSVKEPYFTSSTTDYGCLIRIIAELEDQDATYFNLKWGDE